MYLLLFRIESVSDGLNQSNLQAVNEGQGTVNSGGASGFAMPILRYYVGTGGSQVDEYNAIDYPLAPADMAEFGPSEQIVFTWPSVSQAKYYKLLIEDLAGAEILSAVVLRDTRSYRAPSWLIEKANTDQLRWRIQAFDANAKQVSETLVRRVRILRD